MTNSNNLKINEPRFNKFLNIFEASISFFDESDKTRLSSFILCRAKTLEECQKELNETLKGVTK